MSGKEIRAGIVGCGRIGAATSSEHLKQMGKNWLPLSHADGVKSVSGLSLVALCDADEAAVKSAASNYGVQHIYTDYSKMLKEMELDLLCVATRSDVRPDIFVAAAGAGVRAVHSEKPLALSVKEGFRGAQAIDGKGIAFSYGTLRAYMDVFRKARRAIESSVLGKLQSITVKFGSGGMLWTHPHSVGVLFMLSGSADVDFVQANLSYDKALSSGKTIDTDPVVLSATVAFANGVTGHIINQEGSVVEVTGSEGSLSIVGDGEWTIKSDHSVWLNSDPPKRWTFARDETDLSGRHCALLELRDALQSKQKTSLSVMDAFLQHRVLFAMMQSDLQGGRRVRLDEVDPELVVTGRMYGRVA